VRKRHSPEQIAAALRAAEAGTPVADIIRKLGIHENTFYQWRKRFGGLGTPEIRELRQFRKRMPSSRRSSRISASIAKAARDHRKKTVKPAQ
jgi:putative transposase